MNDHDCHAMDKPIFGCQLLNKEILYSDYFNVKTSRFNWFKFSKCRPKSVFLFENTPKIGIFGTKIHQNCDNHLI